MKLAGAIWMVWAGCQPAEGPLSASPTMASSTVVSLARHAGEFVTVNVDEGSVTLIRDLVGPEAVGASVQELPVGGEPTRIVAVGDRMWVTTRLDGEVVALDRTRDGLVVAARQWVGSEPYGIVASSDGTRIFVAVSMDDRVVELDGDSLEPLRVMHVPNEPRWLALHPDQRLLAVGSARGSDFWTLDLDEYAPTAIGRQLPVPSAAAAEDVRVTGDLAFSPDGSGLAIPRAAFLDPVGPVPAYYSVENTSGVIIGGVVVIDGSTFAHQRYGLGASHAVTHVTWGPGNPFIYGTVEGTDEVLRWRATPSSGRNTMPSGSGPRGVAVDREGTPWVHAAFDLTVAPFHHQDATVTVAESVLEPHLRRGRKLFYTATNPQMGAGGVSCATCHAEGRSDGRTWSLITGVWQTPSLAGNVDATAPVTWSQSVQSVALEAELTVTGPMGGTGLEPRDLEALAAYVNSTRLPNPPSVDVSDEVLALGEAAFYRPEVGCAECHLWPNYTDNQNHGMFGAAVVQTPTLRGIASSAPYLHDGSAETLEQVLDLAKGGEMGHPELLTPREREALIAWLRTL